MLYFVSSGSQLLYFVNDRHSIRETYDHGSRCAALRCDEGFDATVNVKVGRVKMLMLTLARLGVRKRGPPRARPIAFLTDHLPRSWRLQIRSKSWPTIKPRDLKINNNNILNVNLHQRGRTQDSLIMTIPKSLEVYSLLFDSAQEHRILINA